MRYEMMITLLNLMALQGLKLESIADFAKYAKENGV